jgi:uncharacterized protein (TIGR00730 family)
MVSGVGAYGGAMSTVCVFCGSSAGVRPSYRAAARALGARIAGNGHRLVYGGAGIGLMGEVADAALRAGGEVIGVVPTMIDLPEITHARLSTLHRVGTMHQRKALMAELSDLVVTLPGGVGTLDEIAEMLCWSQLGIHRKPLWLLDVDAYYRPLLGFLAHAVSEGFLERAHLARLLVAGKVDELPL